MITDDIFTTLKAVDRNLTENEFTTKYLRTSRSYLCNRRNRKRDVSNDVLLNLYSELNGAGTIWQHAASNELDERRRTRWQQMADVHLSLANEVVTKLLERANN
ncbi:DUF6626 family protein [Haliea sp. E1-2-M8]|uniref:DUF6626 family protein n=1 Tax=Haliea sp. E1-2-M8 TaxID=3064706 RepID=UPI00351C8BA5